MNLGQNLLFFRRGGSSQDELNAQLDRHFERYPNCGMVVYPEGTRNPEKKEMVLKTGMMRVAFRMQLPVQIIMTTNKERVMREKPMYAAERNIECETVFGAVLKPQDFNTAEEFIAAIKLAWQQTQTELDTPAAGTPFISLYLSVCFFDMI
jgi:dsRNA-specific ribonuclease